MKPLWRCVHSCNQCGAQDCRVIESRSSLNRVLPGVRILSDCHRSQVTHLGDILSSVPYGRAMEFPDRMAANPAAPALEELHAPAGNQPS